MSNINVSSLIVPRRARNGRIYATSNGTSSSFSTSTSLNSDGVRKHGNKGNLLLSELPLLSSITDNFNFEVQDSTVTTTSKIVASTLFDYINGKLGLADALSLKLDKSDSRIEEWNAAYSWGNHDGLYRPISYTPTWDEVTSKPTWVGKFGWDAVNNRVTISEDLFVSGNISASEEVIAWVAGAVESDVLANLTTSYPLHKSSNSNIELLLSNQFEVNGSNQLQIKAGVLVPTSHTHVTSDITDLSAVLSTKLSTSLKGVANGLAELDANGFVKNAQLPSYVDDVLEYADFNSLPVTGEAGKIYVTLNNLLTYRWSGSTYSEISASLALGTTSTTAFRGDWGLTAYNYSQVGHLPLSGGTVSGTLNANFVGANIRFKDDGTNTNDGGIFASVGNLYFSNWDATRGIRIANDGVLYNLAGGNSGQWNAAYSWGNHAGLYVTPNVGYSGAGSDLNNLWRGGFYSLFQSTNAPFSSDGGLLVIPTWAGSNSTNRYTLQIAVALGGVSSSYIRSTDVNGAGTWYKLWNEANFNPANYLPLTGGTLTGNVLLNTWLPILSIQHYTYNEWQIRAGYFSNNDFIIRNNTTGKNGFRLDDDSNGHIFNDLYVSGNGFFGGSVTIGNHSIIKSTANAFLFRNDNDNDYAGITANNIVATTYFSIAGKGGLFPYNLISGSGSDYGMSLHSEGNTYFTNGGTATKKLILDTSGNLTATGAGTFNKYFAERNLLQPILTLNSTAPQPYDGFGGKIQFKSDVYVSGNFEVGYVGVVLGGNYNTEADMVFGTRESSTVSETMKLTGTGNLIVKRNISTTDGNITIKKLSNTYGIGRLRFTGNYDRYLGGINTVLTGSSYEYEAGLSFRVQSSGAGYNEADGNEALLLKHDKTAHFFNNVYSYGNDGGSISLRGFENNSSKIYALTSTGSLRFLSLNGSIVGINYSMDTIPFGGYSLMVNGSQYVSSNIFASGDIDASGHGAFSGNVTAASFTFNYLRESGGITYWGSTQQGGLTWDTGYAKVFSQAGNELRIASSSGTLKIENNTSISGWLTATGEVTAYSDRRLKQNIQPLKVRGELNPVTYIKDNKESIGFIAQEVKELYPELVKGEGDEMLSLNYQQLTAVLYAEIIELKNRIKTLEKWHFQTQV